MMEAKSLSKARRLSSDIIITLPQGITEIILCFLPIEEAARTSILSREWRYKWTAIPKLVFDKTTVCDVTNSRKNMDPICKLLYAIHQVLLLRQGPIHEFTLDHEEADHECFELDQIILHLSRNHPLKKLSLDLAEDRHIYKLPLCAYSLHQLTDLDLSNIDLDRQPIFGGFGNLRSLRLSSVNISSKALLHFLSKCPSLKSFTLDYGYGEPTRNKDCTINELFECLPVIEHLETHAQAIIPMLVLGSVLKEFPTSLIHLKYLYLKGTWLADDGLLFLSVLIKFSPNLEKINLELDACHKYKDEIRSGILEKYSDVSLEHLNELEIDFYSNLKPEMEFVKFILARSPKLKKLWISCTYEAVPHEMLKNLLRAQCVSPAEIVVDRCRVVGKMTMREVVLRFMKLIYGFCVAACFSNFDLNLD